MNFIVRKMDAAEYPLLKDFCYESIFVPEGEPTPPKSVVEHPLMQVYYADFGSEKHDIAFVAETDGNIVGAVWVRIMDDFGHIDDDTPSFAIAVHTKYRGMGIGTAQMERMLTELQTRGYKQASLSCQKANRAVKLYRRLGFRVIRETEEEHIMVINFV